MQEIINQQQKTSSQATHNCSWTELEEVELTKTLATIINGQKAYGKDANIIDTFDYYKYKLESKFSTKQVIYAINKYTDVKNDIPAPADIINMLTPTEPKITESQFIEAQNVQKRNGYPQFSSEAYLIKDYHKQNATKQETYTIECDKISQLLDNSIKRIGE